MWPNYSAACRKEVNELLRDGGSLSAYRANPNFGLGPKKDSQAWRLEREAEKKFKVRHAVAVNSGTAALHAALVGLGVAGRDVIVSPYTFSATVAAIVHAGGRPRFADVDPYSYCLSQETVRPHVNRKTAAVLVVNLFGFLPDIHGIAALGRPVIEDACQSVGAVRDGHYAGTLGAVGCYSFNGTKNLPSGEGGMVVTNDDRIAEKARLLANHAENYDKGWVGYNYRMHEVVACIARHGLLALEERNEKRRLLAEACREEARHVIWQNWGYGPNVHYVNAFRYCGDSQLPKKRLKRSGVEIGVGYITPALHHYRAFRKYAKGRLPIVDELSFGRLCLLSCLTPDRSIAYAAKVGRILEEEASR